MRRLVSFAGLVFVVLAFVEIAGIVLVAAWLGNATTVILLLLSAIAGCWVLRLQGRRAWRVLHERNNSAHAPTVIADSLLGSVVGALLILPGFLSTLVACALLLPPVRRAVVRRYMRRLNRWLPVAMGERVRDPMRVKSHRAATPRASSQTDKTRHTTVAPEGEGGVSEAEHMIVIAPQPPNAPPSAPGRGSVNPPKNAAD